MMNALFIFALAEANNFTNFDIVDLLGATIFFASRMIAMRWRESWGVKVYRL